MTCSTSSSSGDLELSSIPGLRLSAPPKPNRENGKEVSEEDPAAVQSALKALQDSSDASVLRVQGRCFEVLLTLLQALLPRFNYSTQGSPVSSSVSQNVQGNVVDELKSWVAQSS